MKTLDNIIEQKFGHFGLQRLALESAQQIQQMLITTPRDDADSTEKHLEKHLENQAEVHDKFHAEVYGKTQTKTHSDKSIDAHSKDEADIEDDGDTDTEDEEIQEQQPVPSRGFALAQHKVKLVNEKLKLKAQPQQQRIQQQIQPQKIQQQKIQPQHHHQQRPERPERHQQHAQYYAQQEPKQKLAKASFVTPQGLQLDPWQHEALNVLLDDKHVVIDAPTSAGKTRVIEALLEYRMAEGMRLVYTSPVKSLSNDKYAEFCEKYGRSQVGINTGDFKENLNAPIILATLETYRNSLLGTEPDISRRVVVYDEYHFLQDSSRGSAWEESIILTPKGSQLVLLSASVPNCDEFAQWISQLTKREAKVVRVTERPVPLRHVINTKYGWILSDLLKMQPEELLRLAKSVRHGRSGGGRRRFNQKEAYQSLFTPVQSALALGMSPIIVYAGRRGDAEGLATSFARYMSGNRYSGQGNLASASAKKLQERTADLMGWEYVPKDLQNLVLRYGIAYHHSGMIPTCRVAIETLLKEGLLKVCYGTMGISLGVNFAVRSALIFDESRPGEGGETHYSNTEVMQMLGRAGRRGYDRQGFSLWLNFERFATQHPKKREPCQSSLKFDPSTVISLLGEHNSISYLNSFYQQSFFMRGKEKSFVKKPLNKIITHLQKVGALNGAQPTEMGNLARYFPQAGGFIMAYWLSNGTINKRNFEKYLIAMASFGSAHFKEIPETHADIEFLNSLKIPALISKFYPENLFPDLYDEVKKNPHDAFLTFREFNLGAVSIVRLWLNPKTTWEELVSAHESKYFSDGDCMNVLFRFATFLQSCTRLYSFNKEFSVHAKRMWKILFREPLDSRNKLLLEKEAEVEPEFSMEFEEE